MKYVIHFLILGGLALLLVMLSPKVQGDNDRMIKVYDNPNQSLRIYYDKEGKVDCYVLYQTEAISCIQK